MARPRLPASTCSPPRCVVLDDEFVVRYANPAAENLLTAGARSLIGQPFLGFFAERSELERALERGARHPLGLLGAQRHLRAHRPRAGAVLLHRDAHRRLRPRPARRAAPDRAGAAPRARGAPRIGAEANRELIRNLAHEIKNPLGGLRGSAQLLERELERAELREYTQVIIKEADRLQNADGPHAHAAPRAARRAA